MRNTCHATLVVCGGQVRSISYSPTGGFLLIACHKPEAAIHDRDGKKLSEFAKGDPYRSDMIHTKGHIGPVNAAQWHPTDVKKAITCADDGTVRLWDTEHMEQQVRLPARPLFAAPLSLFFLFLLDGSAEPPVMAWSQLEVIKVRNNRGVSGKVRRNSTMSHLVLRVCVFKRVRCAFAGCARLDMQILRRRQAGGRRD